VLGRSAPDDIDRARPECDADRGPPNVAADLHPTSTVPTGADSDPTAVVDPWGKVRTIEALRVVDASILPEIPSVPANVTTIMVAERIAARLWA
jgi:choline dehydrogenase